MTPRRVLLIVLAAIGASFLVVVAVSYWPIAADEHAYWLAGQRLLAGRAALRPDRDLDHAVRLLVSADRRAGPRADHARSSRRRSSRWAWIVLMLGCLWWLAGGDILVALAMCAFPPIAVEFVSRNVHLIIAVLLVLGLRRWGGWFSVGAAIKLAPVLGIPYLALRGRVREAVVATAFGAGPARRERRPGAGPVAPVPRRPATRADPADASAFLPVPYVARFVVGVVLMVVAARIEPRIGEPLLVVAVTVALPTLWLTASRDAGRGRAADPDATAPSPRLRPVRHVTDRTRVQPGHPRHLHPVRARPR